MEIWDAYYPDGRKAGVDLVRGEPIPPQYRHGVVEVLVLHRDGDVLLMQRDFRKPNYPGFWEASAGGSLLKGEDFLEAAKRELFEETGIQAQRMEELYQDVTADTIYRDFLAVTGAPKDSVQLQQGETVAYRWVKPEEFQEILHGDRCASNSRGQLDAVLQSVVLQEYDPTMLPLSALQPSQFYISAAKLARVQEWFDPKDLGNFEPLPIKLLDGKYVLTDGHTRAYAAWLAGLSQVPLCLEQDDLDWDAYRLCVKACQEHGIFSAADFEGCVLAEETYQKEWLGWCKQMQENIEAQRNI